MKKWLLLEIVIIAACEEFINHINRSVSSDVSEPNVVIDDKDSSDSKLYSDNCWMKIGKIFLYKTDKEVLTSETMWLNDAHMTCA